MEKVHKFYKEIVLKFFNFKNVRVVKRNTEVTPMWFPDLKVKFTEVMQPI